MVSVLEEANKAVLLRGESLNGIIGTTLTAVLTKEERAFVNHVGDSRAYLVRGREITRLTEDHTLAEELVRTGKATPDEMIESPMRSMLTKSLGSRDDLTIDIPISLDIVDGDAIVLATDGLTALVQDREILSALHNTTAVQTACNQLVNLANDRGGHDNITVVAAEFGTMERIPGLGVRMKTVSIRKRTRTRLILAIAVLALLLTFLMVLLVSHYTAESFRGGPDHWEHIKPAKK
jgi:serine/threonine protein phosphatase PrpC